MVALAFGLLALYTIVYALIAVFGIKFIGNKITKGNFSNTKLLLIVSIIAALTFVILWIYTKSISLLFPIIISLSSIIRSVVELRKTSSHQ